MTDDLVLRGARPDERDALEALMRRASLANDADRDALLANPEAIVVPAGQIALGQVVVADLDGTLAGFAAILPRDDEDVELDGLFVEPAIWAHGIGRALVERCAADARDGGAAALHVVGNPAARGFYERVGFAITGDATTQFGPGLLMRRSL